MASSSNINRELARYMAFAFCTADALLEVQPDGEIAFATGATNSLFGFGATTLVGKNIAELAADEDSTLIHTLLKLATNGQRFQNVPAQFQQSGGVGAPITLNGYNVPDLGGHCLITAKATSSQDAPAKKLDAETDSGLMDADSFELAVEARLANPNTDEELTFIGLTGLPELQGRLSPDEWQVLQNRFGTFLNAVSSGGDTAAQLGDDKFGLLHSKGLPVSDVENQLVQFTKAADPDNIGAETTSQSLDPKSMDLSGPELARAVLYTIRQVADSGSDAGNILSANISDRLQESARNIAIVKATIEGSLFDIAYQPIVALDDEAVHHFEALVRISDPECLLICLNLPALPKMSGWRSNLISQCVEN
ncbi:MAG: PAS domain S-box protein [Alphaproteobacteria bacterium]